MTERIGRPTIMTNEEFQQKMEFIIEQQARFASDIGQLKDVVARLANASLQRFEDVDEKIAALVDSQIRLSEAQARTDVDEKIAALVDSQIRLTEAQARTDEKLNRFEDVDEKIAALVDSQIRLSEAQARTEENMKRTDENLKNLIAVVDRYFDERNGQS